MQWDLSQPRSRKCQSNAAEIVCWWSAVAAGKVQVHLFLIKCIYLRQDCVSSAWCGEHTVWHEESCVECYVNVIHCMTSSCKMFIFTIKLELVHANNRMLKLKVEREKIQPYFYTILGSVSVLFLRMFAAVCSSDSLFDCSNLVKNVGSI